MRSVTKEVRSDVARIAKMINVWVASDSTNQPVQNSVAPPCSTTERQEVEQRTERSESQHEPFRAYVGAARNALSARGSWTVMGDGEWKLNISERERVVFYSRVVRL